MANTIVGQLLPKGVVKGGSALKLRYGDETTRFSRDFDTARAEELEVFLEHLDAALIGGWNGFTGRVIRKEPAKPRGVPGEYIMQPFEVKLAYKGKSWLTVPLEVGHDEIGDTASFDYYISPDIVNIFTRLGFPKPSPVALLHIHHQIAQKLHALSTEGSERAHDMIDLQIIIKNESIDYTLTKSVCNRLFVSRKQHNWPPAIRIRENWDALYVNQLHGLDVLQNVNDAIEWTNRLIQSIDESEVV
jgi:hypothetical protein